MQDFLYQNHATEQGKDDGPNIMSIMHIMDVHNTELKWNRTVVGICNFHNGSYAIHQEDNLVFISMTLDKIDFLEHYHTCMIFFQT